MLRKFNILLLGACLYSFLGISQIMPSTDRKDGIVYDAKQLPEDARTIVNQHKAREESRKLKQPGLEWE